MLQSIIPLLRGSLAITLMVLNTLFWVGLLYIVALFKLIPLPPWRRFCTRVLVAIAENWIGTNNLIFRMTQRTAWNIQGVEELDPADWYLVSANHQTWLDIFVLQRVFNRRIPFLKFFTKQELIWFPVLGLAWWALDFPFMKRYSRETLRRHPELKGKDLETTRKMCARFQEDPVSITNFLEGTRFTTAKHAQQDSPYHHLLRPKAGGLAFALAAMNGKIRTMLNVTIVYPHGRFGFWEFLCGTTPSIIVHVEKLPIPPHLLQGDYADDPVFREQFQTWVNDLWAQKDQLIAQLCQPAPQASAPTSASKQQA